MIPKFAPIPEDPVDHCLLDPPLAIITRFWNPEEGFNPYPLASVPELKIFIVWECAGKCEELIAISYLPFCAPEVKDIPLIRLFFAKNTPIYTGPINRQLDPCLRM